MKIEEKHITLDEIIYARLLAHIMLGDTIESKDLKKASLFEFLLYCLKYIKNDEHRLATMLREKILFEDDLKELKEMSLYQIIKWKLKQLK